MLVMLKLECKNVNYENEINICLEFLYDNNYGTPCTLRRSLLLEIPYLIFVKSVFNLCLMQKQDNVVRLRIQKLQIQTIP